MENVDEHKAQLLFTIKKNQLKMVQRRGYDIEKERAILEDYTLENFLEVFLPLSEKTNILSRSILSYFSPYYENEKGDRLIVYFPDAKKDKKELGVEAVNEAIEELMNNKAKNAIMITPKPISSAARKRIEELPSYNITVFLDNEMTYDPTEHYLTPEHIPLSVEEQRDFLERNNISIDQLPIILTNDKIVRYYGFRQGQVIKIKRTNYYDSMVQETIGYRAVKQETL
jgi:DNA-directed RNA polymerase subunit H (RpoH/RPB5)